MGTAHVELPQGAKVLLRMPNWLGDVVLCTPALAALRGSRPDLELHVLAKPSVRAAVEGLPGVASVRLLQHTDGRGTWSEARSLRRAGFAAALVFPKGFREALLVKLAGIPVRAGLDTDRRSFLLTHAVPFTQEHWHLHHARQFAKVLEPLGIELGSEGLSFPVSEADREEASSVLAEAGVAGPFAAFHITASKAPRAWHAARFGVVAAALERGHGLRAVFVGAPADAAVHREALVVCPSAVDLAGKTSLRGMAAVLERSALFVGNDSGPMHIAAAVGAKVVAVFGPGAPWKTAPYLPPERHRTVYAAFPCSPCRQAFWRDCKPSAAGKPPCLEAISPGTVLEACAELLAT
jgi:heptosyltransferase II